jgi:hypothetical protein
MHAVKAYGTSLGKERPFPTECVAEWAQSQHGRCGGEKINILPYWESKPPQTESYLVTV